jgi:putative DNA primase/helicase
LSDIDTNDDTEKYKRKILDDQAAQAEQQQLEQEQDGYGNLTNDQFEQELINRYHFKVTKDTEDIYYYEKTKGIYLKNAEWLIKQECLKFNPGISPTYVESIKQHIIWGNYIDRTEFDPHIEWLCCNSCMINLRTCETKPHSPKFMALTQIPHDYAPSLKMPCLEGCFPPGKIMQFLHQVMGPEDVETVLDFMAYSLWRGFPFHKYLFFNGSGRNGKGVTTNLMIKLLGVKNVSSESLDRILENRFSAANLFGKMANIDADLSSEALKRTGLLKKLTGGDQIMGEFKYKPAFPFVNHAKIIFSANKIPITPDESDAFFARLIIINFPNQFLGEKDNSNLTNELTTEPEMSAFLTLLVRRLPRVLKSGISHADSHTIEDNYLQYMQSSDPIRFFKETAIRATNDDVYVLKEDLFDSYRAFCTANRLPSESIQTFSRKLKDLGLKEEQKRISGQRPRVWKNIKLIDWAKPDDEDQETL